MAPPTSTDAEDVRLALAGDPQAYGRLYDRHAAGVRAVVAAVGRDLGSVDDLTQEAFLRGYRRLASLRCEAGFAPWVRGIARLVTREWLRRQRVERGVEIDQGRLIAPIELDELCVNEERRQVLAALAELPERERLAVHAYYFSRKNADEAADSLGLSRSGYYSALERAMEQLRRKFAVEAKPTPARRRR